MITSRDKTYAAAQKFQQKGQLDKAIIELERLVQEDPADVRTLLKIGDLHVRRGDTPAAIATYIQVAQAYRDEGFSLKAVAVYKQVVHLDPANAPIAHELAALYEQLGLISDAAQQYRALLQVHKTALQFTACIPVLKKLMALEGETQDLLLQWAEAHTRLDDVPEVKRTLTRVADTYRTLGRDTEWAHVAEELLQVDPDLTGLACELAKHYMAHDEPKQALLKLQLAFRAAPQDTETLTLLVQVFEALGQVPKAIAVLHELASQARQRNQALAAERITAHILKLNPDDAQAKAWAANASPARGPARASSAQRVMPPLPVVAAPAGEPAASLPQNDKLDLTNLLIEASVFARYGLRDRALEYLNRVLTAFPDHAGAQAQYEALMQPQAGSQTLGRQGSMAHARDAEAEASPGDKEAVTELVFSLDALPEASSWASTDLDALIAEMIPDASGHVEGDSKIDKHFDAFLLHAQEGLATPVAAQAGQVDASDYETQYNLGIAYREMGLFTDAIGQFKRIAQAPAYAMRAHTMLGLCYLQAGKTQEALATMAQALALPHATANERAALHYEMATAYAEAGDAQTAHTHFMHAHAEDPTFRDVAARLVP